VYTSYYIVKKEKKLEEKMKYLKRDFKEKTMAFKKVLNYFYYYCKKKQ